MPTGYSVKGSVRCHDTPHSRKVLDGLTDGLGEIEVEVHDHDDKTFTTQIAGGLHCSYSTASDLGSKITALGPFAIEVGYFETDYDGEKGDLWVGKEADVQKLCAKPLYRMHGTGSRC